MKLRKSDLKQHQQRTRKHTRVSVFFLKMFVCGNFQHQEEEDETFRSLPTTPKKSRKSSKNNNPYSDRGLDKFSALVADLEQRRKEIYSRIGSDHISLVRFVYSNNSNDVVPIVVKLKENKQEKLSNEGKHGVKDKANEINPVVDKFPTDASTDQKENRKQSTAETSKKRSISWKLNLHKWRRPSFYMPVFIILILILLVFVGRSVAVLCTSIGWYLLPTLSSPNVEKPAKKKVYLRRHSELKARNDGNGKDKWHKQDEHRKSF